MLPCKDQQDLKCSGTLCNLVEDIAEILWKNRIPPDKISALVFTWFTSTGQFCQAIYSAAAYFERTSERGHKTLRWFELDCHKLKMKSRLSSHMFEKKKLQYKVDCCARWIWQVITSSFTSAAKLAKTFMRPPAAYFGEDQCFSATSNPLQCDNSLKILRRWWWERS